MKYFMNLALALIAINANTDVVRAEEAFVKCNYSRLEPKPNGTYKLASEENFSAQLQEDSVDDQPAGYSGNFKFQTKDPLVTFSGQVEFSRLLQISGRQTRDGAVSTLRLPGPNSILGLVAKDRVWHNFRCNVQLPAQRVRSSIDFCKIKSENKIVDLRIAEALCTVFR